jgi:hypothetical protein
MVAIRLAVKVMVSKDCSIATEHTLASLAGSEVMRAGGNAFDAAVAASFALSCENFRASTARRPGAQVLNPQTISRRRPNSRSSSAERGMMVFVVAKRSTPACLVN